jgi:hypothetical protein
VHGADEKSKKESVNEEDARAEHVACVRARRVVCSTRDVPQNIEASHNYVTLSVRRLLNPRRHCEKDLKHVIVKYRS